MGQGNPVGPWRPLVHLVGVLPQEPLCDTLSPPSPYILLTQGSQPWLYVAIPSGAFKNTHVWVLPDLM